MRNVAIFLLALWLAAAGAFVSLSLAFGGGRSDLERIVTTPYDRAVEVIRAVRERLGGDRDRRPDGSGHGRMRDCACL